MSSYHSRTIKIILFVAICIVLISVAVIYHINAINTVYAERYLEGYDDGYREGYDKGYDKGYSFYNNIKDERTFYRNHAVIVTETGKRYHRYGCYHIKDRSFYIYNTENAKAKGYTPCHDCFDSKKTLEELNKKYGIKGNY